MTRSRSNGISGFPVVAAMVVLLGTIPFVAGTGPADAGRTRLPGHPGLAAAPSGSGEEGWRRAPLQESGPPDDVTRPPGDWEDGPRHAEEGEASSPFLLKSTDAEVVVTGPVAHAVVIQAWENPNAVAVDGLYIFPLPENSAVTDMTLRIGGRTIRGEMKRREEARALYERARRDGRVAGLLDQERPNVFAQQVANILPGMRIEVVLSFDSEIRCEEGRCELDFPAVVGPRFIPCRQTDPGRIAPPVAAPGRATGQRLAIRVLLDEGVPVRNLESPSHRIEVQGEGRGRARVTLSGLDGGALDRDFRLRWRMGGDAPEMGVLAWRDPSQGDGTGVFTLVLQPPAQPAAEEAEPRELVFVLDCSGSMRGVPLEAAKRVVREALAAVRPEDTFQIIRFSDRASGLGPEPLSPTPANLRLARRYLDSLQGQGGTEMISGIRAALGRPADPERLRIVAFLTDGYIGNEGEILAEVRRRIGTARIFSFGIGSSVNRYLLEGLAEEGRGEAAFLGPRETPDEMVERFVRRIATPVLTDIHLTWEDLQVEDQEPRAIPDLFAGSPLVVHGRYHRPGTGLLILEGTFRGERRILRRVVTLPGDAADHEALGRLWARARIHRLMRELHGGSRPDVVEEITRLGLRHHLMTATTSLVAVDSEVSNWSGSSVPVEVPVEMPRDVSYEGVFGLTGRAKGVAAQAPAPLAAPLMTGDSALRFPGARKEAADAGGSSGGVAPGASGGNGSRGSEGSAPGSGRSVTRDVPGAAAISFTRVSLFLRDGTEVRVESDGEVWRIQGRRRTLLAGLTPPQMQELRRLLERARPGTWTGGGSSGRILFEGPGITRVASVPSGEPAIQALAEWIRRLGG